MNIRRSTQFATLAAVVLAASTVHALEKHSRAFTGDDRSGWRVATTCNALYYNTCTDWVWVWNGWLPTDRLGVQYDTPCLPATLIQTAAYIWSGAPAGYGFTGTLSVYAASASRCPTGSALASTPWLPAAGWNVHNWNVNVPLSLVVLTTLGPGQANPVAFATDHPAAGPSGPTACGTCYPTTRPNHSFAWGDSGTPLCPGAALNDGACDAQLLWAAYFSIPTSAESSTWGTIKALYR